MSVFLKISEGEWLPSHVCNFFYSFIRNFLLLCNFDTVFAIITQYAIMPAHFRGVPAFTQKCMCIQLGTASIGSLAT